MENLKKYNEIFMEVFSVEEKDLGKDFNNKNVGNWDSIHQMNLISYIEDTFDVMFAGEDALNMTSYENGIQLLSSKYGVQFNYQI
jgi:acyl carrier protein